jgi:chromosome segregation protein
VQIPKERILKIEDEISALEKESIKTENNELTSKIKTGENNLYTTNSQKSELLRKIGRLEGQINSLHNLKNKIQIKEEAENINLNKSEIDVLKSELNILESESDDFEKLKNNVRKFIDLVRKILHSDKEQQNLTAEYDIEIQNTQKELIETEKKLKELESRESQIRSEIQELRKQLENDKSSSLEAEKKIITLMSEKNDLQKILSDFAIAEDAFNRDSELFKQELIESVALVGRQVLDYENIDSFENDKTLVEILNLPRTEQITRRKDLERLKIKVEETVGAIGEEVVKEFEEVTERDNFLISEITDLEKSAESLRTLIVDLENQIEIKFKEGLNKINKEFQKFFELMFGGGNANLKLIKIPARRKKDSDLFISDIDEENFEADQEAEEGVEISVNLPRKKIKDLMMLSGGERALTSIALLFAISQVNPPPFIILDETDAALDEANSRKYGDMIESLSKYSQLILITHNRETMSRAGVIYGVTMIQGVSQLLSIALEEGIQFAK